MMALSSLVSGAAADGSPAPADAELRAASARMNDQMAVHEKVRCREACGGWGGPGLRVTGAPRRAVLSRR
jgi:hypothetical protein